MGQDFHVCQTKPGGVQQAGGFIISGVQRAMNAMEHCITKRPALQPISRFSSFKNFSNIDSAPQARQLFTK